MPSDYSIAPITDDKEWDAFASTSIGGTPFNTSKWLKNVEEVSGGQQIRLGLFKNATLRAGLTGIAKRRGPFIQLGTPELSPHTGILLCNTPEGKGPTKREAEWQAACNHFIQYLSNRYDHIRITHTPDLTDLRPFSWAGWDLNLRYTYQLPLENQTESELWERVERRTRTAIRKAEKLGYECQETDDIDLLCDQYEKIYENGPTPINSDLVRRHLRLAFQAGLTQIFSVKSNSNETAAIVAFVKNENMTYAWVAGADPDHNNSGAASLLYWRYICQCSQNHFDFVGANLPSVAFFKRGMGGNLVPYYTTEYFRNEFLRNIVKVKSLFNRR